MPHYYDEKQESDFNPTEFSATIRGFTLTLLSASGVFSKDHVDTGSYLLADRMILPMNGKILDIGCGIGVLGIVAAKMECHVLMSDVNERAVALSKKNIANNSVSAKAIKSDLYEEIDSSFDCILSNPPQSAGKEVCFKIIEGAFSHLHSGGTLQLVARHNKGGGSLSKKMEEVFGNVSVIAKRSGFSVYLSRKSS